jgi:surfeit locus 1 family protein
MRLGPFEFRPRPFPALVTLVLLGLLVGLGLWQLDRAQEKRALLDRWQQQQQAEPRPLAQALAGEAGRFAPVRAEGRFDSGHQFLVDNRIRGQRPGFHVLTPLRLSGSGGAILVNRGWVAMGEGRSELPALPAPEGPVRVTGHLAPPPQAGIRLGQADAGKGRWPKVIQYLDPERAAEQLGYPVIGRVIRLDPEAENGFQRDWGSPIPFGPERHVGYAVQWFALALTLVIIFLVVNSKRRMQPDGAVHGDR